MRFVVGGFFEFVFAVHLGEESGARKIKAIDLDFVRCLVDLLSFSDAEAEEVFDLLEGLGFGGFAYALELVETFFVAGDGANDAGFVEGGVGEGVVIAAPGLRLCDGGLDLGELVSVWPAKSWWPRPRVLYSMARERLRRQWSWAMATTHWCSQAPTGARSLRMPFSNSA